MKSKLAILALVVLASPTIGRSDTLHFTVNPANTGIVVGVGDYDVFSPDLNGTVLAGQSLSLDFVLTNDELARLSLSDPGAFGIGFDILTNAGTFPGFTGPTTGFLLDPNGNQIGQPQIAGRADSSDGSFGAGLVEFTFANLGGSDVVDISGVHFDTSLPATGFVVTNTRLRFSVNAAPNTIEFGTEKQLPEPGTLGLVGLGFALMWRRLRSRARSAERI